MSETKRPTVDAAEELLGLYFDVYNDDKSFISLQDYMGSDLSIDAAARVSYGAGTRKTNETRGLIRYLRNHYHSSPSEMMELKFHISCPIFVMRQIVRTRTANLNEYSGRYSLMPMLFYTPSKENFNYQSIQNNQGRGKLIEEKKYSAAIERWNEIRKQSVQFYEDLTSENVARELARIDLPLSTFTQFIWKIDLHNFFRFLSLRCDAHAQFETRAYANILAGMAKKIAPLSYEAWIDYEFAGTKFSRMELNILKSLIQTGSSQQGEKYILPANHSELATEKDAAKYQLTKREFSELYNKLQPKEFPDFELDLSTAKTAEYFQEKMNAAVPRIDKLKAAENK